MPAEIGHCGQQRLNVFERYTVLVVGLTVTAEFVDAQATHTGRVPLLECCSAQLGATHCDAAQPRRRTRPVSYTHLTLPTICSV